MMLAGVILSGLGYMLLAGVDTYSGFLAVYLGVISLSFSAGFMHSPWFWPIAGLSDEGRWR